MEFEFKDVKHYDIGKTLTNNGISGILVLNGDNELENFRFCAESVTFNQEIKATPLRYDLDGMLKPTYNHQPGQKAHISYSEFHDFFPLLDQYTKKKNPALHEFKNLEIPFYFVVKDEGSFRITATLTSKRNFFGKKTKSMIQEFFSSEPPKVNIIIREEDPIPWYDRDLEIDPNDIRALSVKTEALMDAGKFEDTLVLYDKMIKIRPDEFEINKGDAFSELGRYEDALVWYDKALEYHQKNARAIEKIGNAFFQLGRYDYALVWYDKEYQSIKKYRFYSKDIKDKIKVTKKKIKDPSYLKFNNILFLPSTLSLRQQKN